MPSSDQHPLDYALPPARQRMPRWNIVIVLIIGGALAWLNAPWLWRDVQFHFHLRRCMAYTAPADQVVYQENAAGTAARYPQPAGRRFVPLPIRQPVVSTVIIPKCWRDFPSEYKDTTHSADPVEFMHERTSPAGERELVVLVFQGWTGLQWQFETSMYSNGHRTVGYFFPIEPDDHSKVLPGSLTFFAGQPDPADSSHFTIGYSNNAQSGVIDCWLGNGQTIRMQIRDGPAKTP